MTTIECDLLSAIVLYILFIYFTYYTYSRTTTQSRCEKDINLKLQLETYNGNNRLGYTFYTEKKTEKK